MADAAGVAGLLWDSWLPLAARACISGQLPDGDADGRRLAVWMAAVHDLGKASPSFATMVPSLADRMRDHGLPMNGRPIGHRAAPHSLVSHHLLERWLTAERGWNRDVARTYAVVPGGHHGVTPTRGGLTALNDRADTLVGTGLWRTVQDELASYAADLAGVESRLESWREVRLRPQAQVLVTATVILADWLASNIDLFPYGYETPRPDRLDQAWRRLQLPGPWRAVRPPADVDEHYRSRFTLPTGAAVRSVQCAAVEIARAHLEPGLMIIEATMGTGKTEAALAVAEIYAHRRGAGGVMLALPTQATSDAMFGRLAAWAGTLPHDGEGVHTMFLAHGKSSLNEDFGRLVREGDLVGVAQDEEYDGGLMPEQVLIAHSWLFGRKKGVLADFVVGTIDQLLFAGLRSRHLVLRHLALANKVVVIDECHAYDAYMSVFLERVLAWLGAYGVPVVVLSATLPSQTRRSLVQAYDRGADVRAALPTNGELSDPYAVLDGEIGYPVISGSSGGEVYVHPVEAEQDVQRVQVERLPDDLDTLVELLTTSLEGGGCAAVVRNTVQRAQDTYLALKERFPGEVLLDHARLIAVDRVERESRMRAELGPPRDGAERPQRLIVVGTQVIEQSLDLDFDLMVSDLAPTDLLLQRIGRLHRHRRDHRPAALRRPGVVLVGVENWWAPVPEPVKPSSAVYDPYILLRTLAVLHDHLMSEQSIVLPDDIATLVERTYSDDVVLHEQWRAEADAARTRLEDRISDAKERAKVFALAEPTVRTRTIAGWEASGVGDAEDARGQGRVRDSDESIEVIVVQRVAGELRLLPWVPCGAEALSEDYTPAGHLAEVAASCTVRLPWQLTKYPADFDRTLRALELNHSAGWQSSHWLKGQLPLVLDEELRVTIGAHTIRYDPELGLLVEKETT